MSNLHSGTRVVYDASLLRQVPAWLPTGNTYECQSQLTNFREVAVTFDSNPHSLAVAGSFIIPASHVVGDTKAIYICGVDFRCSI